MDRQPRLGRHLLRRLARTRDRAHHDRPRGAVARHPGDHRGRHPVREHPQPGDRLLLPRCREPHLLPALPALVLHGPAAPAHLGDGDHAGRADPRLRHALLLHQLARDPQSVGIQKLYLGRAKAAEVERKLDATLIYAAGVVLNGFALWKYGLLSGTSPLATVDGQPAAALVTAGAVALLGAILTGRVLWVGRRAGRVAWQRLAFGLTGIAMYSPYLVIDNLACAFLAGLLPHYMQYHGIFWLVGRNKYPGNPRYADSWLGKLAQDFRVWVGLVVVAAFAMGLLRAPHFLAEKSPALMAAYHTPVMLTLGAFYGLGWMHFYLDGLLFRFRYPEVRAAILRYLKDPRAR